MKTGQSTLRHGKAPVSAGPAPQQLVCGGRDGAATGVRAAMSRRIQYNVYVAQVVRVSVEARWRPFLEAGSARLSCVSHSPGALPRPPRAPMSHKHPPSICCSSWFWPGLGMFWPRKDQVPLFVLTLCRSEPGLAPPTGYRVADLHPPAAQRACTGMRCVAAGA